MQTIPGISETTAAALIAEIGVDMNQFPTAEHLASRAGILPGTTKVQAKNEKKRKRQPTRQSGICEAAWAIARSRTTVLATKFWKIASRRGKKKACIAIADLTVLTVQ
ncbi:transposase [Paenibacillus thiaminolyticus]|uniref:transposase n=1 Tax=Paenibacillus thiaminolyticus TaxID=49283 RepID=UPI003D2B1434